jgi:hypothetical protein
VGSKDATCTLPEAGALQFAKPIRRPFRGKNYGTPNPSIFWKEPQFASSAQDLQQQIDLAAHCRAAEEHDRKYENPISTAMKA